MVPTNIEQTGTNRCDLILDSNIFGADSPPAFKFDKGANLIQLNNIHSGQQPVFIPNVQPEGWRHRDRPGARR